MIKLLLSFILAILVTAIPSTVQATEITQQEFDKTLNAAHEKAKASSRRMVKTIKELRNEVLTRTEEYVYEYSLPNKRRYVHTEKYSDREARIELIQIDNIFNCRKNKEDWTQSISWCADSYPLLGTGNPVESHNTVERLEFQGKQTELFRSIGKIRNFTNSLMKSKFSNFEHKYWLDADGFIIREESWRTSEDGKELSIAEIDIYEFDPKDLKIDAPLG